MMTNNVRFESAFGLGAQATLVGTGSSTGSSETVTVPAGTAEGDIVVMGVMTVNSVPNAAGPSGGAAWNELYRFDSSTNEWHAVYWKVCGASEPASWTLTQSSSEMSIGAAVFRGNLDAVYGFTAADGSLTPGRVVGHPYGLQVLIYLTQQSTTLSAPPGSARTTAILVAPGTGDNCQVLISYANTTWAGDADPVKCGGNNNNFAGSFNIVFYPS